jgi:predicted deacylase
LFEPAIELGEAVDEGSVIGFYHYIDRVEKASVPFYAPLSGFLLCVNGQTLVDRDDTVPVIVKDYPLR